jgi:hypothetical protein
MTDTSSTTINRTLPIRLPNAAYRIREYLTDDDPINPSLDVVATTSGSSATFSSIVLACTFAVRAMARSRIEAKSRPSTDI